MKAYLDASVVLRIILRATNPLAEWPSIDEHISSALLRVECLRTLERLGIEDKIADDEIARRSNEVRTVIESSYAEHHAGGAYPRSGTLRNITEVTRRDPSRDSNRMA